MADETILIVDDDRTIVRLCQRLLERASYQVVTAIDPLDALRILEQQHIDLLLSDIRMPVMDGFELVSRAKNIVPDLPVLVMTGYGSIENAIQALHRGVEGLILKPFENTAELVHAVRRVLEESRQRRDAARLQALRPLFDVTERLLAETSPHPLEKLILNAVTGLFQAKFAGIFRWSGQKARLEIVRTTDSFLRKDDTTFQQRLTSQINISNSSFIANTNGPGCSEEMRSLLKEVDLEAAMFASVRRNSSEFLFCACRESGGLPFTEADLEMFVILARQAGVAMENARLYSELKDYVRQVEESQRALIQTEKMAAVGRLMASLAHEINNPLQSVRNCLHLAARHGLDLDKRLHYLNLTDSELERLVFTVRRMLNFYRPGGADKEKADVQAVIEQVLGILAPQMREMNIQVNVQYSGEPRPFEMVPGQIQQVIFNLLLNAMDALDEVEPQNGEDGRCAKPKVVWIDVMYMPDRVRITIEDTGAGVPQDLQERIFEPFVSTKQHGTGLGLSVSYGIMERHQGGLSIVAPRYANGACFEMVIPFGVDV